MECIFSNNPYKGKSLKKKKTFRYQINHHDGTVAISIFFSCKLDIHNSSIIKPRMANSSAWAAPSTLRTFPVGYNHDRHGVDCYICGRSFSLQSLYKEKEKKHGIYSPSAMVDNKRIRDLPEWNIFYRMCESVQ